LRDRGPIVSRRETPPAWYFRHTKYKPPEVGAFWDGWLRGESFLYFWRLRIAHSAPRARVCTPVRSANDKPPQSYRPVPVIYEIETSSQTIATLVGIAGDSTLHQDHCTGKLTSSSQRSSAIGDGYKSMFHCIDQFHSEPTRRFVCTFLPPRRGHRRHCHQRPRLMLNRSTVAPSAVPSPLLARTPAQIPRQSTQCGAS